MKILIIEDEKKAARELAMLIHEVRPQSKVVDIVESVEDSITWLNSNQTPDLVFSDIQLSDGLCFEIFKRIRYRMPVIFCTAYNDFMMDAFVANGIYYILKPVTREIVEESMKKYEWLKESLTGHPEYVQNLEKLFHQVRPPYHASLLVNHRDKIIPVKTDDIVFLYYNDGVISVYVSNQEYRMPDVLEDLENRLNPTHFFRANRQFIINRKFITEIERSYSRKLVVKMSIKTPEPVVVSKVKSPSFLSWVETGN